jgi:hydroxymethylpyrimidine/phosphomethylpyrimidine kinase
VFFTELSKDKQYHNGMKNTANQSLSTVLSIAGSDSSAGAGLQADLKTIHALGGYALTVPTAITAQNSFGVAGVYPLASELVRLQLETLFADYQIQAIKIGMLGNLAILKVVIECLQQHPEIPVVLDPVLISSSGQALLEVAALPLFINQLLPLATVITPNIPELNAIIQGAPFANQPPAFLGESAEVAAMAQSLFALGVQNAVIKGGHSIETDAVDYLVMPNDKSTSLPPVLPIIQAYSSIRIETANTHGTGCTFAAAIATELAKGKTLPQAVQTAKDYLFKTLKYAHQAQPKRREGALSEKLERKGVLNHFV